jgi:ABC-type multidrug transport system fused ATPase/permease subunit
MKFTTKKLLSVVWEFAKPFRKSFLMVLFIIIFMTSIDAINSYFMSKVFDSLQTQTSLQTTLIFCLLSFGFVTLRIVLQRWREILETKKLDVFITNHLNHQSIAKFFTFSNGQHINEHSGVKQSIITSGFSSIQNFMNMLIYNLIPHASLFLASLVIFYYVHWSIGLVYTIGSVIYFWQMLVYNKQIHPKVKEVNEIRNQNSRFISEVYRYVFLIKNEVAEKKTLSNLEDIQSKFYNKNLETWTFGLKKIMWIRLVPNIFRYSTMLISVWLFFQGLTTIGGLFLVFTWSSHFINSLWWLAEIQKQFITDKINIEKYFEMLEIPSDIEFSDNPVSKSNYSEIEFKSVEFSYPKRTKEHTDEKQEKEPVLKSISFKIESGEKVAFVGESGSGKSTIANLIRRAFDPQSGEILIDGVNLRDLELSNFLKSIGSVDQEVILFDRSLRDNISFGLDRILTNEELESISKKSGVSKFFHKLEHGWDTIIGERGCKLSGGERQRIGIARALAKKPEILIFDEATSALDSVSETFVQKSIDESCKGKTSIVIAHRLSTVKNCDRIFVMKDGEIICSGTHRYLLSNCEYYNNLIKNQLQEVLVN